MAMLPKTAKTEIRNLLSVILGSVLGAFLLAAALLHYYNPSGRYTAGNLLLAPAVLDKLNDKKTAPFLFDGIELMSYDAGKKQWKKSQVSKESYGAFYQSVSQDLSLESKPDLNQFNTPLKLQIKVKEEDQAKVFQELEVPEEGSLYRILVDGDWVYFQHERIGQEAHHLLKP